MLKEYFQLFLLYLTDILYWFKSLYKGLKNLIYYFKVIYKDRHSDFLYIYKLELYKIQVGVAGKPLLYVIVILPM